MKLTSPNLSYAIILGVVLVLIGNLFTSEFQSRNKELIAVLCIVSKNLAFVNACIINLTLLFRLKGYL